MKHKQILALLVALALLLTACSHTETELTAADTAPAETTPEMSPSESPEEPPEESPEEPEDLGPWMEDWELFWQTLNENYPFGDVLHRTKGRTLEEIEAEYRPAAERVQSANELLEVLTDVSGEFGWTGHLFVHSAEWYASFYNIVRNEDSDMCRYEAEIMGNEKSLALYGWTEDEDSTASNDGGPTKTEGEGNTNLTFAYYPEQKAAYVEVRQMYAGDWGWEAEKQALLDFFQTIEAEGYEHCIIDITQNSGGSTYYYQDILVRPNITKPTVKEHYILTNAGDEVMKYYTACGLRTLLLSEVEELPQEELPALEPSDLEWATHYGTEGVGTTFYSPQPAFSGRFWLLVGPRVYSASEAFAIFCKDSGFATLVGQTTGGDGIGINPLVCVLPNSGVVYQFSTMHGLNLDGSSNEEMGTTPDILVPEGEDVLQACLRAIEEAAG